MLCRVTLIVGVLLSSPQFSAAQNSPHVPGELLIAPKAGVSEADLENQYKAHGGQKIKTLSQIKVHHIKVPAQALEAIEAALRKNPKVEYVEKNFIASAELVPNDPGFSGQWHLSAISSPGAWDINTGSSSVVIAVLDSGADINHPDLALNLVAGHNFLDGSNNVYDNGSNSGHGTAVSGVISATGNNGIGVSGVSWNNSIMPLVVVQDNWATYSAIASAINYAADHGAKVINMSLGGTSYSSTLQSAVNYAWNNGLVSVAAAGNSASSTPIYPAALDNVIAVSGTDQADNLASFTSFGDWVDVAAPATPIYTTMLGGGYGSWQGTSFSAPQVAGLAGLLFSHNPSLTNQQVVDLIKNTADDLGAPGFDPYYGNGRINAYRALLAAPLPGSGTPPPPPSATPPTPGDTTPPTVDFVSVQYDGVKWLNVNTSASDSGSGVAKVEIYVDGSLKATDTSNPYSFKFNTRPWPKGTHTIQVKAYDAAGNVGVSNSASVTTY